MPTPVEDLEIELVRHPERVLVLAGAGVACATDRSPCASWIGLLRDGLKRCRERCHGLTGTWFKITEQMIDEQSTPELVQAASRIEAALRIVHHGEYGKWLADSVGGLKLGEGRIVKALLAWKTRIATTNYDNLFEDASGLRAAIWTQGDFALQVLRGDHPGILHLHGHYAAPDSVVFGVKSYEDICRDVRAQNLLRSVFTRDTIVFVGCGAGIQDPNFGGLLEWTKEALRQCQHSHFHLVRESDIKTIAEQYQGLRITVVSYGADYGDLAPFLESLGERAKRQRQAPDRLANLISTQGDYETNVQQLRNQRDTLTPGDFVRRNFELARELWQAGGRRTAALQMHGTLIAKGEQLPLQERIAYTLEAVEYQLEDSLDFNASVLLEIAGRVIDESSSDAITLSRFRLLLTQCLSARAQLDKLIQTIDAAIPAASGEERTRLEAEKAELYLLNGNPELAERTLEEEEGVA